MGSNKRDLKAYVRYDGSGRVVAGSLILRRNKPKVGNWQQVQGYECCNQNQTPVLVGIDASFPFYAPSIEVGADNGDFYQYIRSYGNGYVTNIDELATVLQNEFKNLGHFKVIDGDLYWTPNAAIAEFYTLNHTTALYAYVFSND